MNALTAVPYDTTGFTPFTQATRQENFDFNSLPKAALNLDNLISKPLQFTTAVLPPPVNAAHKTIEQTGEKRRAYTRYRLCSHAG